LGCTYSPPSDDKSKWFATEEVISGRISLDINSYEREPFIGPAGFGGFRRVMLYFAELNGDGPVYKNPIFGRCDAPKLRSRHWGTISVDTAKKEVVIDLREVISTPDEPLKTKLSAANGTYPLKQWTDRLYPR
jgi:hypothetical protein